MKIYLPYNLDSQTHDEAGGSTPSLIYSSFCFSKTSLYIDSIVDSIVGIETAIKPVPKIVVESSGNISSASIVNDTTIVMYEGKRGIEEIRNLISRGINATDNDGYTALMFASKHGYTELVKELIAAGG